MQSVQATLDAAKVLGACDDFLSGVATLAEADAVQEIEIEHLRDEGFARAGIYLRQAVANVGEAPVMLDSIGRLHVAGGRCSASLSPGAMTQ
jgi:hypothetical protein